MALFSDGSISSVDDLAAYDSGLLDVATAQGINVTAKLTLAQTEIGVELESLFERNRSVYMPLFGQPPVDLQHLAVTPPMKLWHVYHALELFYKDAYFNQLNDRFKGKWQEFAKQARWAMMKLLDHGVGVVFDPVPQATTPVLTTTAAPQPGGVYYIAISFINASGEEGSASTVTSQTVTDGNVLVVQPTGVPTNVRGWNVYAGSTPAVGLQTAVPVGVSQTFTLIPGVWTGRVPNGGQSPNANRWLPRYLLRG